MILHTQKSLPSYGGQAIIEGVMMRGQRIWAIAVRAPDQSIVIKSNQLNKLYQSKMAKIPFLRGLLILWDALVLGVEALTFSVNIQAGEDEKIEGAPMILTLVLSLSMGVGLFFLLPAGIAYLTEVALGFSGIALYIIEGGVRLALLIGYIWGIGNIPDIRRVYGYHGAEHKTINAYEAGAQLEVKAVATFSRLHPRCGTAFLLTVVILSIVLFALIGPLPIALRLLSRILLIPFLAMLAYEYIRFTARHIKSPWIKPLVAANLALQNLTTREPDEDMLEIAIAAFNQVLQGERQIIA
ncbi:MAG: DUF1385 domain-containing protein [Chloroflexi bacterium]|nr:DUF1385 domain-containing protein [Chloroflexota bacterium]